MRYWDDLREPTANFVQMPFQILESSISAEAKVLYMYLWKDAFTNRRWTKGNMYAQMSYKDMAKLLGCSERWAITLTKEMIDAKFIEKRRSGRSNKYFFIKGRYWKL